MRRAKTEKLQNSLPEMPCILTYSVLIDGDRSNEEELHLDVDYFSHILSTNICLKVGFGVNRYPIQQLVVI